MVTVKSQQRGLGRGLSALISENYVQTPAAAASSSQAVSSVAEPVAQTPRGGEGWGARDIPIAMVVPGKFQPRGRFDEERLKELSASIRKNGIMQPIVVRHLSNTLGETYEIVAGERRWRAAQMAGLTQVPAVVRELSDQQSLELALIENVQRADLTPLEEAAGYQRLFHEFGYTQEELSTIVGKSRSHIANLLRLLSLPEEIKQMLEEGKITMGHARPLIGMPPAQSLPIAQAVAERGLSVRQVEQLARSGQGLPDRPPGRSPRAPRAPQAQGSKDPDVMALEQTLSENLGMRVAIHDRGDTGELLITYESLSQLDSLLQRLSGGL